jgi:FeS assembly SUF system regulator
MLRISKLIDYGTLVLTQMASKPDRVFSAADLAATLKLGHPTVSKVLKTLGQHNLVISSRGARGGYMLARAPEQINLAQIIDALDEQPFGLTECTSTPGVCAVEPDCHIRTNWERINAIVRRTLEEVSVADMVGPVAIAPVEFYPNTQPAPKPENQGARGTPHDMEFS